MKGFGLWEQDMGKSVAQWEDCIPENCFPGYTPYLYLRSPSEVCSQSPSVGYHHLSKGTGFDEHDVIPDTLSIFLFGPPFA